MFTGADLRRYRRLLGMKQAEFAARMGIAQPTLSLIEGGTTPISEEHLNRLADRFNGKDIKHKFTDYATNLARNTTEGLSALTLPTDAHYTLPVWRWEEGFNLNRRPSPDQAVDLITVRALREAAIAFQMPKKTGWWAEHDIIVFEQCQQTDIQDGHVCLAQVKTSRSRLPRTMIAVAHLTPAKRGRTLQLEPVSPEGPIFDAEDESLLALLRAVYKCSHL